MVPRFDDCPGQEIRARRSHDGRHQVHARPLPPRDEHFAAGDGETLAMLDELLVQSVRGNGAHLVGSQYARHGDRFRTRLGGFERELDGSCRELRRAVLHADFGERAGGRVGRERHEDVGAALDFDPMMREHLVRSGAQEHAERPGRVERDAARTQARVGVGGDDERAPGHETGDDVVETHGFVQQARDDDVERLAVRAHGDGFRHPEP